MAPSKQIVSTGNAPNLEYHMITTPIYSCRMFGQLVKPRLVTFQDRVLVVSTPGRLFTHKALSHLGVGNLDEAIKTTHTALLYEAPWDDENKAKN